MKASDYIVDFLIEQGINHIYGYQGTMIAHLVDSIHKSKGLNNHSCYNEQGAGFAAVGQAKATGRLAVCYSTSGPGAANLISAIADAYYDSAPVLFITGQLNTYEYYGIDGLRQNGFQEMDVISAVSAITKYCTQISDVNDIRYEFEKAVHIACDGRPGPVVIDLPMDMQRQDISHEHMKKYVPKKTDLYDSDNDPTDTIVEHLNDSTAPLLILGNGIQRNSVAHRNIIGLAEQKNIPIVTSILGRDLIDFDHPLNFGHIGGGYGHRYANMIACKKTDLVISLGCSLCKRQTAFNTAVFAENARIIRVDIDEHELQRKIHDDDIDFLADCNRVIETLYERAGEIDRKSKSWLETCDKIKSELRSLDDSCDERQPNILVEKISGYIDDRSVVCVDIGQHQMWASQSFNIRGDQQMLFSGGHGAMGFALPAAIGAYYATNRPSIVLTGDGSIQMNIQELQWLVREKLPVTIIIMNNRSLGLIRQQQDDLFEGVYAGSEISGGYDTPDFCKIGEAYGIYSVRIDNINEIDNIMGGIDFSVPNIIDVSVSNDSKAVPKTHFGEEMYDQRPYIPDELMDKLLDL